MDTSQKIELFDLLIDSASCYKNEARVAFGLRPLPELAGQLAMSSNKTNAENNKTDDDTGDNAGDDAGENNENNNDDEEVDTNVNEEEKEE